ncbi:hypothetical protein B0H13DRAFT_2010649 [Mycena leptocephala]|nr:hypothetical protein B0H13DRAFT_2010649 [Mycena leptocephala]
MPRLDTVRARLRKHNISYEPYPIDLDRDILDVTVRRDFMSDNYGGNPQETYPKISEAFVKKTGLRNFMYLNLNFNPHCPEIPGAPGLLFGVTCPGDSDISDDEGKERDEGEGEDGEGRKRRKARKKKIKQDEDKKEVEEDTTGILFARLAQGVWQYQGQYVTAAAEHLTIQEWKQQSPKVQQTWAYQLSIKEWGRWVRAEVTLRRELGRKPTPAEKKAALRTKNNFFNVTPAEIYSAFNRGEVVIMVWTMKCVGYNTDLQRNLAAKFPSFVPKPPKNNRNKTTAKPKRVGKASPTKRGAASTSRAGQKRKREERESDDDFEDDSDLVPESEDEDEGPREIVYRHQGTRSRPIVL